MLACKSLFWAAICCIGSAVAVTSATWDYSQFGSINNQADMESARKLLQSGKCRHVYLDLGTNVGVQIRKLYYPEKFPNAEVLAYFDKYFGPKENRKEVCAFGFEPNARWVTRLGKLESKLTDAGFNTVIFKETAVGIKNGNVTFYIDEGKGKFGGKDHNNWGSSMFQWNKKGMRSETAGLLDIVSFIQREVLQRPGQAPSSKVFVKMDVEGAEYDILPAMLKTDVFCEIDAIVAEFHPYFVKGAMLKKHYLNYLDKEIAKRPGCKITVLSLDDESYVNAAEE